MLLSAAGESSAQAPGGRKALTDPRQQMRNLVRRISAFTRRLNRNFTVVTQGGLDLLEKVDAVDATRRAPASTYIRAIDGVIVRGLNYRPPLPGKTETKTEDKVKNELLRLADLAKRRGLKIWVTDYAPDAKTASESFSLNKAKGFVPMAVSNALFSFDSLPRFPSRPINENPKNVTGLKSVRNFAILTDSAGYDSQEDFVLAMSGTNFDAIVVDVFHRGRTPLSKRSVQGLKFKKLGAKRLVLAYVNVGEAESYRYYWKPDWREGSPRFISAPTLGNPDKYNVRYWDPAWQDLVTNTPNSYIYGAFTQGFDGIVLDGVDSFHFHEGDN